MLTSLTTIASLRSVVRLLLLSHSADRSVRMICSVTSLSKDLDCERMGTVGMMVDAWSLHVVFMAAGTFSRISERSLRACPFVARRFFLNEDNDFNRWRLFGLSGDMSALRDEPFASPPRLPLLDISISFRISLEARYSGEGIVGLERSHGSGTGGTYVVAGP